MHGAGPGQWLQLLLSAATWVVMTAIVVRVIGLWMGAGRFRPWMRPVYLLTDWIIEPIRRRLPPTGAVDLSPLAAYALLFLVRLILLPLLTRPR
jgi:YggT family protein